MRKKRKTSKKANKQLNINKTSVYAFLILFFLISYVFIFNENIGFVGKGLKNMYFYLFGLGSFVLPLLISALLASFIFPDKIGRYRKKIIACIVLSFALLIFLDNRFKYGTAFLDRFDPQWQLNANEPRYGVIAAALSYASYKMIGDLGIYIAFILCFFLCGLEIFGLTIREFLYELRDIVKIVYQKAKTAVLKIKNDSTSRKNINNKEEIKIPKKKNIPIVEKREIAKKDTTSNTPKKQPLIVDYKNSGEQMTVEDFDLNIEKNNQNYKIPPLELLKNPAVKKIDNKEEVLQKADTIEKTLEEFGIKVKVVQINTGPTVTCYEVQPAPGVKVSRIVNMANDLSLNLASSEIRIEAPIPGKSVVGIEVANELKDNVLLKEIITSDEFRNFETKLPLVLGKNISGKAVVSSIDSMPHLLIAGATGSGKSVCINTLLISLLYHSTPEDVKLILIDPKVVELSIYNGIPHLAIPVVTNPKKASSALNWAVREMERRYQIFSENHVRDIKSYNRKNEDHSLEHLPYIVIVIDELSDLMMVAAGEVEDAICRLAQMARACGIHLIIATQRPTVDVITGTIKANIPSRISFQVTSQIDSRTILDISGAEKLLGKGDMLFFPSGISKPKRIQGAFVSDREVENIVNYIKDQNETNYDEVILEEIKKVQEESIKASSNDDLYDEAVNLVVQEQTASISFLQRKLKIGYARAGRLIDEMEENGVVSGYEGSKPRKVLKDKNYLYDEIEEGETDEYSQ